MAQLVWICLGGAVGTGARYLLSTWALATFGPLLPWGTLAVNLIGSFLTAVIMYVAVVGGEMPATVRLALTTGLMGGFTTYSAFNYETMRYLQEGALALAAINVTVTLVGCLGAAFLGWATARALVGA